MGLKASGLSPQPSPRKIAGSKEALISLETYSQKQVKIEVGAL